jgi:hypothetical protein
MNKNIILKTFDEVKYFHRRILFAVTLKEKVTFLILSNEPIFDIENLRNYLIESELNHFAKNEIINLIELIDSFLKFEKSYNEIPKSENHYSYEYPTKGKGVGSGNLMYILKVNNQFLKSNETDFNEKEPLYSRLTSLNYFNISNRLLEIKDLFANYLEPINTPQQTEAELINNYKKAISGYFEKELNYNWINDFNNSLNDRLNINDNLKERIPLLTTYNNILCALISNTVQLFIACSKYDGTDLTLINDINFCKFKTDDCLKAIAEFKQNIQHNKNEGRPDLAIKVRDYCSTNFNDIKIILNDYFFIDIKNSPLKNDFDGVLKEFENSINLNEIIFLNQISKNEQPQETKTNKPKKLKKTLFEFIHNIEDKEEFIQDLKNTFPTEMGKDIRVIIDRLKKESILTIEAGEYKHFVESLTLHFGRNIGEYQGIQNKMIIKTDTTNRINKKLNPLITKHKTN